MAAAEDPADLARRIAGALRAAVEAEEAFGTVDLLLPERSRARASWATAAEPDIPAEATPEDARDIPTLEAMVSGCRRCHLAESRTQTVPGDGAHDADLLVVGEAPGAEEDRRGVPFVGRAGQLLTKMLAAIELDRSEVYICNVLKCRPPGNRNPEASEIASCLPFLKRQIDLVNPKVILALGAPATRTLLETRDGITKLRGRIFPRHGARCVPSFHPAYLLRNPAAKREAWADLQLVRRLLDE
jgi:uracil-DNA glycosylase family 4